MKSTTSEIKIKWNGIYSRLETMEENISNLKDIAIKLSKINMQEKRGGKKPRTSVKCKKFHSA